jgi:hypothetical protein
VLVVGDTDIDATGIGAGALTLNGDPAPLPSLDALIIAMPDPTAFTSPDASTVATAVFELSQVTVLPESCVPVESRSVAVAMAVWPITAADGLTATITLATGEGGGAMTVMLARPDAPSLTALTTVVPGATAEITPESVTLAIDAAELYHVTARSGSGVPFSSLGIATARAVCPATSEAGTETATDATLAGVLSAAITEVPPDEHAATLKKTRPVTASMKVRIGCALPGSVFRRLDWRGAP